MRRINISLPLSIRQQIGAYPGPAAASVLVKQLGSLPTAIRITRDPDWDQVLGEERILHIHRAIPKTRRRGLVMVEDEPDAQAPDSGKGAMKISGPLERVTNGLYTNRQIFVLPMPELENLRRFYAAARNNVHTFLTKGSSLLTLAEGILSRISGLSAADLHDGYTSARNIVAALNTDADPTPQDVHRAAILYTHLGLIVPGGTPVVSPVPSDTCRVSVPLTSDLRSGLLEVAQAARLSVSLVGYTAILADYWACPLQSLLERIILRRAVLTFAKQLVALGGVIQDYKDSIRAHEVRDPEVEHFILEEQPRLTALEKQRSRLLRVSIGLLAGQAETQISSLVVRSSKLSPFCAAGLASTGIIDRALLEAAAAMAQKLWGESAKYQTVAMLIRRGNWEPLHKPYPA